MAFGCGLVSVYQSPLESAGISAFVRNSDTQQAIVAGVLTALFPLPDFWPTLCVMDDEEYPTAMKLFRDAQDAGASPHPDWLCPGCGESVPQHFAVCWNCGRSASG